MKKLLYSIIIIVILVIAAFAIKFFVDYKHIDVPTSAEATPSLSEFSLPEGFSIEVFAQDLSGARVMQFDPKGNLLVSQPNEGKITSAVNKIVVMDGLNKPHGFVFKCESEVCKMYVAETNALSVFDYDAVTQKASGKKKLLDLPSDGYNQHYTRTITFTADQNTLLISIGSSCNVCDEGDDRRAKIISYDLQTGKVDTKFARGLRNSVFMAMHPVTGALWATEMGRDGLGDDVPPDEVNIIEKGKNYGWPVCYGKNIHDTEFDKKTYIRNPCMEPFETASHIDLQAHSSPLGLAFIPEEGWDEKYWFDLLVAYHGSWNRSEPTGYKIVRIDLDEKGNYIKTEDFITGFLDAKGQKIGRPVDIKVMPGGVIYISDDGAGRIYKVTSSVLPR
jgi:glucose/arabinose dehydrogenase